MEFDTFPASSRPEEIILTYRQQPAPVELSLERPLPQRMAQAPAPSEGLRELLRVRRQRARHRLIAGGALLAVLIALGVGIFLFRSREPYLPAGDEVHSGEGQPGLPEDGYSVDFFDGETTIALYRPDPEDIPPVGLAGAAGREALAPGEIYERLSPATVTVLGESAEGYGVGTGIIITEDGYILTNYHVIAGCSSCRVWVTSQYGIDQEYSAYLVGGDEDQDLAVLKIMAFDLPVAELGVSDELGVGDSVYAIGNPLGLELRGTFTDGIVSAVDRVVDVEGVSMTLIQTNAELNSGNSGGPLINQYGQVVGINTIKMMSGYEITVEGLGFAIPTSYIVRGINDILATGEIAPQPVLGITINKIPVTLPDGTTALEVAEVTRGLGADRAGVRVGDCIVSFNGQRVGRTEDVLAIRRGLSVGDWVPILLWRDGEYLELSMEMLSESE